MTSAGNRNQRNPKPPFVGRRSGCPKTSINYYELSFKIRQEFHFGASLLFSAQDAAHGVGVAALKIQAIVETTLLTEDLKTTALVPRGALTDRYV